MKHRILSVAVLASMLMPWLARGADQRPPNIIYILADDLGYGELGCYGQEKIRTPNLDRLASEGMRFTQHYSGSPVCASSRCVLMTGKHTGRSFIRGNKGVGGWGPEEPEGQWPIPAEEVTIAELLRDRGYATCAVGKWGLGGPGSTGHPCYQGFDHFYGYLCQRVAHNYYPTHLWRNHDVDVLHGNRHFAAHQRLKEPLETEAEYDRYRGEDYAPEEIATEALKFMHEQDGKGPFFLYYASVIPHVALQAPRDFIDRYPRDWDPEPYLGDRSYLPTPRPHATYAAMITFLDDAVGRIMTTVDELGIADNTIIIFSSDNGTTFNGGCDREFFDSLPGLRGHKCTVFEGGLRVPMVARWSGRIEPGSVSDHASTFDDVLPTLLDLAGEGVPDGLEGLTGTSFAPTLLGTGTQSEREYLYWEYPESNQQQALLLEGRFKGVRTNLRKGNVTTRVYDLRLDPGESTDIGPENPELVARIERLMDEAREPSELFPIKVLDEG